MSKSGNIRVAIRVRPFIERENGTENVLKIVDDETIEVDENRKNYNHIFDQTSTQSEVFEWIKPLFDEAVEGVNCSLFMYGQTGTGKTYTILGEGLESGIFSDDRECDTEKWGIIPRSVEYLFQKLLQNYNNSIISCSYIQIYNEKLLDLLDDPKNESKCKIVSRGKNTLLTGVIGIEVSSVDEIMDLLSKGNKNRKIRATQMNEASSRSHAILQLKLQILGEDKTPLRWSYINLIDLAGCERYDLTLEDNIKIGKNYESQKDLDEKRQQLNQETININQSLSVLHRVITTLSEKNNNNKNNNVIIPYRDSKLTYLLKDSLGGNSQTVLIATLSPSSISKQQSKSTLNFASTAAQVVSHIKQNVIQDPQVIINQLRNTILKLNEKLVNKDKIIEELKKQFAKFDRPQTTSDVVLKPLKLSNSKGKRTFSERFRNTVEDYRESKDEAIQVDLYNENNNNNNNNSKRKKNKNKTINNNINLLNDSDESESDDGMIYGPGLDYNNNDFNSDLNKSRLLLLEKNYEELFEYNDNSIDDLLEDSEDEENMDYSNIPLEWQSVLVSPERPSTAPPPPPPPPSIAPSFTLINTSNIPPSSPPLQPPPLQPAQPTTTTTATAISSSSSSSSSSNILPPQSPLVVERRQVIESKNKNDQPIIINSKIVSSSVNNTNSTITSNTNINNNPLQQQSNSQFKQTNRNDPIKSFISDKLHYSPKVTKEMFIRPLHRSGSSSSSSNNRRNSGNNNNNNNIARNISPLTSDISMISSNPQTVNNNSNIYISPPSTSNSFSSTCPVLNNNPSISQSVSFSNKSENRGSKTDISNLSSPTKGSLPTKLSFSLRDRGFIISFYYPSLGRWFDAVIDRYDMGDKKHHLIVQELGEAKWKDLRKEKYKIIDFKELPRSETPTAPKSKPIYKTKKRKMKNEQMAVYKLYHF